MFNIVAILEIKNAEAFEEFESQAIAILRSHNGSLISAFEVETSDSSSQGLREVHCIQFPTKEDFERYRIDADLVALSELRDKAIANTEVYISTKQKSY